jgi:hypothetical protein
VRYRPIHLLLLFFQAFWLNAVVPGHERGVIVMPGGSCNTAQVADTRPSKNCCGHRSDPKNDSSRKERCAICFFAARLTVPEVPDLVPAPTRLSGEIACVVVQSSPDSQVVPTYLGRGPPAA